MRCASKSIICWIGVVVTFFVGLWLLKFLSLDDATIDANIFSMRFVLVVLALEVCASHEEREEETMAISLATFQVLFIPPFPVSTLSGVIFARERRERLS